MRLLILVLLCVLPSSVHAAVVISEVAWMGSVDSPNDEWIELHNTGSTVSLEGWTLTDGANLSIALSGSIEAGAYAVLERSDDTSAPGSAFLIYTGALANSGLTLYLYRTDNSLEDQVGGGENWENIGGNNESKETAQKSSSGWKTAIATPGRAYEGVTNEEPDDDDDEEGEEDQEEETGTAQKGSSKPVTIELQHPDVALTLEPLFPDVVYVHQNVVFDVKPGGLGKTQLNSLTYEWNYGDISTQSGKKTTHTYKYPGEYVVTLYAAFGYHEQVVRKTISVLPVTLDVSKTATGDILIQNNAKYEVNISGFTLVGKEKLVFPPRSVMLASGSITIPKEELGGNSPNPVVLFDQKKLAIASTYSSTPFVSDDETSFVGVAQAFSEVEAAPIVQAQSSNFSFKNTVTDTASGTPKLENPAQLALLPLSSESRQSLPLNALPLLGLGGIVTVAIIAVVLGRRKNG